MSTFKRLFIDTVSAEDRKDDALEMLDIALSDLEKQSDLEASQKAKINI